MYIVVPLYGLSCMITKMNKFLDSLFVLCISGDTGLFLCWSLKLID